MKAGETSLFKVMNGVLTFIVPIYQRRYSWDIKQCDRLWRDILKVSDAKKGALHFIGAIVYIDMGTPLGKPQQFLLIDGQQRMTTLSLLLCALSRYILENDLGDMVNPSKIVNYFLINREEAGEERYKLLLTEQDRETFIRILDGTEDTMINPSYRIMENFLFFRKMIANFEGDISYIYEGVNRLMLVAIALDKFQDNPQLIFESLNSTGKDLSQADLIRNFLLMDLSKERQTKSYKTYWRPMEELFGQAEYGEYFDDFMRDFLTCQNPQNYICRISDIYETLKQQKYTKEELLKLIFCYSGYYTKIHLGLENDSDLAGLWNEIRNLDMTVTYPFFMQLYDAYYKKRLTKAEFMQIIKLVISYLVRRIICEIPSNTLNRVFATLYRKALNFMSKMENPDIVKAVSIQLMSNRGFPTDDEFKAKFVIREIYKLRIRNYILESLENVFHKEKIDINREGYTIEHIIPQNEKLSVEWREMLGDNWRDIQRLYLHTIGNLTLTGYNSELGDKSFAQKRDMEGGFKSSHLRLNDRLANLDNWNEEELNKRAIALSEVAVKIWSIII